MINAPTERRGIRGLLLLFSLFAMGVIARGASQDLEELHVGHWVVIKGDLQEDGSFLAAEVELAEAEDQEFLLGTVTDGDSQGTWIEMLDQRISLSDRVRWRKVDLAGIVGSRVKIEGYYRGLSKFSARTVALRDPGRDRIAGRIDALRADAGVLELDIMRFLVKVPLGTEYARDEAIDQYPVIEQRAPSRIEALEGASGRVERVDEDYLPGSIRLTDTLLLGLRAEFRSTTERDYDLDGAVAEDRIDDEFSVRGVLVWNPHERFFARAAGRVNQMLRQDEVDGYERNRVTRLTEAYGYWSGLFDMPIDVQFGRQDYYDEREWLWDENLDAIRLHYHPGNWRLELAAATTLGNGGPREEATERVIAQLTHQEGDHMLGAYLVDQRADLAGRDYPIFGGLRAYGDWIPDNNMWGELGVVRGYQDFSDLRGWGGDIGTTYSPSGAKPWYFSAGYAFGSGDRNPNDLIDHAFRQTGIQDNNDKFGGVTSFKYYGEILEPELSNLHIMTAGVGRRFGRRISLDLVYHKFTQDEALDRLRNTNFKVRPNGTSTDIGQELDVILGHRSGFGLDTELVLAAFDPGRAFDDARRAYLVKLQLRYRF